MKLSSYFLGTLFLVSLLQAAEDNVLHSIVHVPVTQEKALCEAMNFLRITDKERVSGVNARQRALIKKCFSDEGRQGLERFSDEELQAFSSYDFDFLNRKLAERDFKIRLEKLREDDFGVVAFLKVAFEWRQEAQKRSIEAGDKQYPAIELNRTKHKARFSEVVLGGQKRLVVSVPTKGKDTVHFAVAANPVTDELEMKNIIANLREKLARNDVMEVTKVRHFDGLIVPMVSLDIEKELDWMIGVGLNEYIIAQAKQQTKFAMDEKGIRVKDAVALGMTRCAPAVSYVINSPFFVWIEREGVSEPYFSGYITPEHWKKP